MHLSTGLALRMRGVWTLGQSLSMENWTDMSICIRDDNEKNY